MTMDPDTVYRRTVTAAGRVRYEPIGRYWDAPVWPEGAHLVVCRPGCTTTHYRIDPDIAAVEAALVECREAMAAALSAATAPRPDTGRTADLYPGKTDADVHRAWKAWTSILGDAGPVLTRASAADVIDAGLAVLRERLAEGGHG
jgi:hypothetical protein